MFVAGLDVGGSSVKAWVSGGPDQRLGWPNLSGVGSSRSLPVRRTAHRRVELDPATCEALCRAALADAVDAAGQSGQDYLGMTLSTLRQGFVLLDRTGEPLGDIVLNSDGRGEPYASVLDGAYATTGHWPAAELTLPKLLAVRAQEPDRWAATRKVLFLHDWLLYRLTGLQVTEASYACAGAMADVAARDWAWDLLLDNGIQRGLLAPVVQAGTLVGELLPGWPLPAGLPVVAGCGDTQLAAMGMGGLADGVVTVVAGSSTPVQVATSQPLADPLQRPWVSTHATAELWAAEGNAGYPGTFSGWWSALAGEDGDGGVAEPRDAPVHRTPGLLALTAAPYWSPQTWLHRPPVSLLGLQPDTTRAQVHTALLDAHAYGVRGNIEDLERALGRPASAIVICGGAANDARLTDRIAEVLGRAVHRGPNPDGAVMDAGRHLVATAVGAHSHLPTLPSEVVPPGDPSAHAEAYAQWCTAHKAVRTALRPAGERDTR